MLTPDEHLNNLVINAYGREMEVYAYQINIDNYTLMLQSLPQNDWPDNLVQYKDTTGDKLPHEMDPYNVMLVADYQYRDRLRGVLRTEMMEQSKAKRVRDARKIQIGDQYTTLLAEYKVSQAPA
jgi:hypothetical protein